MVDIIVKKAVRDAAGEFLVSGDFYDALDGKVKELVDDAKDRAKANGRKTLKPQDI